MDERTSLNRQVGELLRGLKDQGLPIRYRKNWGGRIAGAGEPDWTGCAAGRYWAIETKDPKFGDEKGATPSPAQKIVLEHIRQAGGVTLVTNRLGVIEQFMTWLLNQPSACPDKPFLPTKTER